MFAPVNYLALLVVAVLNMVLGSLWFGPVFGKVWMESSGIKKPDVITPEIKKQMTVSYILMFAGSLVTAFVLTNVITFAGVYFKTGGAMNGIMGGIWTWVGFVAPVTMGVVLWDGKSWKSWAVTYLYYLVSFVMMGAILGAWM